MASALSTASPGPGRYRIPHTITLQCLTLPTTMNTRTPTCAGVRHRQLSLLHPSLLHHGRGRKAISSKPMSCVGQSPPRRDVYCETKGPRKRDRPIHPPPPTTLHSPHPYLRSRSICSHSYVLPSCPVCTKRLEDLRSIVLAPALQSFRVRLREIGRYLPQQGTLRKRTSLTKKASIYISVCIND